MQAGLQRPVVHAIKAWQCTLAEVAASDVHGVTNMTIIKIRKHLLHHVGSTYFLNFTNVFNMIVPWRIPLLGKPQAREQKLSLGSQFPESSLGQSDS